MSHQVYELEQLRCAVVRILSVELKSSEERICRARSLRNELGLDSIAAANATFALEDEFGVDIEIGADDTFDTLEGLVELLAGALARSSCDS